MNESRRKVNRLRNVFFYSAKFWKVLIKFIFETEILEFSGFKDSEWWDNRWIIRPRFCYDVNIYSDLVLVRPIILRLKISSLCLFIFNVFGSFFENNILSFENGGVDNPESDESSPELNESSPELSDFSFSGVVNPEFPELYPISDFLSDSEQSDFTLPELSEPWSELIEPQEPILSGSFSSKLMISRRFLSAVKSKASESLFRRSFLFFLASRSWKSGWGCNVDRDLKTQLGSIFGSNHN